MELMYHSLQMICNIHYNKKSDSDSQSPAGSDQQAECMGSGERLDIFPQQNSKLSI